MNYSLRLIETSTVLSYWFYIKFHLRHFSVKLVIKTVSVKNVIFAPLAISAARYFLATSVRLLREGSDIGWRGAAKSLNPDAHT